MKIFLSLRIVPFFMNKIYDQECLLPFETQKIRIFDKQYSETDPRFGYDIDKRPISLLLNYGIVNLDKPAGPSSHEVSAFVRKILELKKAGHSGTLDPKVTGVLSVALNRATKINRLLLTFGKEYVAIMHLHDDVKEEKIKNVVELFKGKIKQLPPVKSAVKRVVREREIYELKLLEISGRDVLFRVSCQAGTYIRKLIHDIGISLGCGAQMTQLRRTKVGPVREESSVTLQDLTDAFYYYKNENNDAFLRKCITPVERAIMPMPAVWIKDSAVDPVCNGFPINVPGIVRYSSDVQKGRLAAIFTLKGELVGFGNAVMGSKNIRKASFGTVVKIDSVLMPISTYPKYVKKTGNM